MDSSPRISFIKATTSFVAPCPVIVGHLAPFCQGLDRVLLAAPSPASPFIPSHSSRATFLLDKLVDCTERDTLFLGMKPKELVESDPFVFWWRIEHSGPAGTRVFRAASFLNSKIKYWSEASANLCPLIIKFLIARTARNFSGGNSNRGDKKPKPR